MKLKTLAVMLFLFVGILKIQAQNFPGYRSANYNGVNGVFFNPANIADSRYRWDVNLFSINGFVGNNKADFKLKDITATSTNDLQKKFLAGNGNTNANINTDVFGPSVMFNLNRKSSMAITSRARAIANLKDMDGNLLTSVFNSANSIDAYNLNSNSNSRLITNGWAEVGLSYAREIAISGHHFFKAGITIKYLSGSSNNYLQINQLKTNINVDRITYKPYMENSTGTIGIGNSGSKLNNIKLDNLFNGNGGIGGDIGFVYEYRPDYTAESSVEKRYLNKYKFKLGLSLLDIGSIKYTPNANTSGFYNINITGNNRFYVEQLKDKNFAQVKAILDANPSYFINTLNTSTSYKTNLPAVLQVDVDYHLHRGFYVSANGQLNLVSKTNFYSAYQYNSITLAPRYEGKSFGIYLPVNYSELTKFNAGISLRAGPVFIGSGSLFTALAKSKQADIHVGLRIGILHKAKKEHNEVTKENATPLPVAVIIDRDGDGIIDSEDSCPDVKGIAKYKGCPIPDTDGDGINDEEDKCPTVAGTAKYQGCPIPDTDGDGINDEEDKCPNVAGIAKYQGCPIPDTDGDGVNDEEDKCSSVAGLASNMGCPEIAKAVKDKIHFAASKIFFGTGSAKFLAKSNKSLDGVASLLKADTTLKMYIDGYTDNTGKAEKNLSLSNQRAVVVKDYLVSKGVSAANLISTGHGVENSVADNKTADGRAKNRRVELTVKNY